MVDVIKEAEWAQLRLRKMKVEEKKYVNQDEALIQTSFNVWASEMSDQGDGHDMTCMASR